MFQNACHDMMLRMKYISRLWVPPKLLGDVLFDYGHSVELLLLFFFFGFLVVLFEVGDVFGVGEVFFAGV